MKTTLAQFLTDALELLLPKLRAAMEQMVLCHMEIQGHGGGNLVNMKFRYLR
ncbi:MAG: hypothetical protein LBR38_01555 [Synergistaceae bacterium]|jgi:hypothetical protein|nr:hypothetical protein [Synergistaceae bacterium]